MAGRPTAVQRQLAAKIERLVKRELVRQGYRAQQPTLPLSAAKQRLQRLMLSPVNKSRDTAKSRDQHLRKRFGLSLPEFEMLSAAQQGKCAICSKPVLRLNVDHNHKTGQRRDLLCRHCNWGLGHFKDDPILLGRAIVYLRSGVEGVRFASALGNGLKVGYRPATTKK
jgi:hypothetical protein